MTRRRRWEYSRYDLRLLASRVPRFRPRATGDVTIAQTRSPHDLARAIAAAWRAVGVEITVDVGADGAILSPLVSGVPRSWRESQPAEGSRGSQSTDLQRGDQRRDGLDRVAGE